MKHAMSQNMGSIDTVANKLNGHHTEGKEDTGIQVCYVPKSIKLVHNLSILRPNFYNFVKCSSEYPERKSEIIFFQNES